MKTSLKPVVLALALTLPLPAHAQTVSPYQALVDALASRERLMENFGTDAVTLMVEEARRDPELAAMDEECPGTFDLMGKASLPYLVESHERAVAEYRTKLVALFEGRLKPEDAKNAAAFYSSEDGKYLIGLAQKNESVDNVLADVRKNDDGTVSAAAFAADRQVMQDRIRTDGDKGRLQKIGWGLITSSWFAPFEKLKPEMHGLELELVNDDFSPEEEAAFDAALENAMTAHFEACYDQ